ncbi:hypothetical protein DBV23_10585 [Edwardsiella ictaluri]|nr:hypothetical protein DBV23_10585 [Edwardsiella ictaluri]EKS7761630.1 family 1 glycosylhydrolase [Edwardsiella ictaluri]EKS7769407.1 family 1 glycosylhydrolase [Edwardsiella ictaluri]EKS7772556.1 family 1 glycosylhydrolase [Edwardsiella ictaluri]EKS7775048.1 family 1 glycosylhydrolase [Edwardsiella ictaluri]
MQRGSSPCFRFSAPDLFNGIIVCIGLGYFIGRDPPVLKDPCTGIQACYHVFLAIAQGADARSDFPWSFIDLLSWLNGYQKQYGFVHVACPRDLMRCKKCRFYWYQLVIRSNGAPR